MRKLFMVILAFVLLVITIIAVMWAFRICPPQGPWPMPPWCENDQQSKETWQQPQNYTDMISGPEWELVDSDYKITTGHTFMDIYNTYLFNNHLESTIKSMKSNNAKWVIYDNYWSYHSLNPPIIGPFENDTNYSFRNATEKEIQKIIQTVHEHNMKFALMSELNFDMAKGAFTTWEENQKFWNESASMLNEMGNGLNSPTVEINEFWDEWFLQYTKFILSNAEIAEKYSADMLVIGKQIDGAVRPGNMERWQKLIKEVRNVYKGPIAYAGYTINEYSQFEDAGFMSELDYIILYMYNRIHESENPSIADLKTEFENIIDNQADKFYKQSGKKVILLTPFQSRQFGAKQEWFEPGAEAPDIKQDLLIQAKMYEALFQAVKDEESIEMVWTWGYWWLENDFNREDGSKASFEKSSTVRNKPAAAVINKWSQ